MTKSLSEIIVVSDLDGTLLTAESGIPACNLDMIKLFKIKGGNITFATGRNIESTRPYVHEVGITLPVILYNGAVIYDYVNETALFEAFLPKIEATRVINDLKANFKGIGIEIMTDSKRSYIIQSNDVNFHHKQAEKISYLVTDISMIHGNWYKILCCASEEEVVSLVEFTNNKEYFGLNFVASSDRYFEILPGGANKGTGLQKLCDILGFDISYTVAIGDYYNDIEMLTAAATAVSFSNAPKEIQALADKIVVPCLDGGVAQLLFDLIKKYEE